VIATGLAAHTHTTRNGFWIGTFDGYAYRERSMALIQRIVSGGQTGADRAALDFAI